MSYTAWTMDVGPCNVSRFGGSARSRKVKPLVKCKVSLMRRHGSGNISCRPVPPLEWPYSWSIYCGLFAVSICFPHLLFSLSSSSKFKALLTHSLVYILPAGPTLPATCFLFLQRRFGLVDFIDCITHHRHIRPAADLL